MQQELTGEHLLVAAIVRQAISDARHAKTEAERRQAAAFLAGSDGLKWWCALVGIDMDTIVRLVHAKPRPRRMRPSDAPRHPAAARADRLARHVRIIRTQMLPDRKICVSPETETAALGDKGIAVLYT